MARQKKTTRRTATKSPPPAGDNPQSAIRNPQSGEPPPRPPTLSELAAPAASGPPGLVCPKCGCMHFPEPSAEKWDVTHTKPGHGYIRRRRVCRHCGRVITTRERIE